MSLNNVFINFASTSTAMRLTGLFLIRQHNGGQWPPDEANSERASTFISQERSYELVRKYSINIFSHILFCGEF